MIVKDRIHIGDLVEVTLFIGPQSERAFQGFVQYMPLSLEDSWIFLDTDGNIRYVREFIQIIKAKPKS